MAMTMPATTARPSNRPARGGASRALRSISSSSSVSPRKITSSSSVDRPDTLKRQSSSQPRTRIAESHATLESKSFLARKKVSTTTMSKSA